MIDPDEVCTLVNGATSGYDPDLDCYYVNLADGRHCRLSVDVSDDIRYAVWIAFWSAVLNGNHVITPHMP